MPRPASAPALLASILATVLALSGAASASAAPARGDPVEVSRYLVVHSPFTGRWQAYSYRGGAGGHTSFGRVTITFSTTAEGLAATIGTRNHHTGLDVSDSGPVMWSGPGSLVIEGKRRWAIGILPSGLLEMRLAPAVSAGEDVTVQLRPAAPPA